MWLRAIWHAAFELRYGKLRNTDLKKIAFSHRSCKTTDGDKCTTVTERVTQMVTRSEM